MDDREVDWRKGSAVGLASAEFSTRRAAEQLERAGFRLAEAEQPVLEAPAPEGDDYDLLIIGAGSAAFAAAIKATDWAPGLPWWNTGPSAAPASTSAVSPPKRCFGPPSTITGPATPPSPEC